MEAHQYVGIAMWHGNRGSLAIYIRHLQEQAARERAPHDVIYRSPAREWVRVADLTHDHPFRWEWKRRIGDV